MSYMATHTNEQLAEASQISARVGKAEEVI